ncbi:MAG: response regulator [Myxococcales bacterium]|nr:response regulator [Myxococcales bacterium]
MDEGGLRSGARVAIIGGGVCGAGVAAALLNSARARTRSLEVTVFEGSCEPSELRPPVVLTPECRSRLAALGCRVHPDWRARSLEGAEVFASGQRVRLSAPPGALWVVDGEPPSCTGTELVRRSLSAAAALLGATFLPRAVQQLERLPPPRKPEPNSGPIAVFSQGKVERFDAAVLATGAAGTLGERFFRGFRGPPTVPAAHARLRYPFAHPIGQNLLRLMLAPVAGVEALYLIPCGRSVHAVGFGPAITPVELCQALMAASRDGVLRDGFELAGMRMGRVPSGAGRRITSAGMLAVGAAGLGHPLQVGLAEALSSCTRAAVALLDAGGDGGALERRYVQDGMFDLIEDAAMGSKALRWLLRARHRAPDALERARRRCPPGGSYSAGVLGLGSPDGRTLLSSARRAGLWEILRSAFFTAEEPAGRTVSPEPNLFFIVEDDETAREALTHYLESQGAKVVAFSDELSLFAAVAQRPPTAVLLDVVLSWVDGLRLCEGLKRHPLTRAVRVLVTSGLDRPHIRARALAAGAEAFLPKPLDPPLLWAALAGVAPALGAGTSLCHPATVGSAAPA